MSKLFRHLSQLTFLKEQNETLESPQGLMSGF